APAALARCSTDATSRTHTCSSPGLSGQPSSRSAIIRSTPPRRSWAWISLPPGIWVLTSAFSATPKTPETKSTNPAASSTMTNGLSTAPPAGTDAWEAGSHCSYQQSRSEPTVAGCQAGGSRPDLPRSAAHRTRPNERQDAQKGVAELAPARRVDEPPDSAPRTSLVPPGGGAGAGP